MDIHEYTLWEVGYFGSLQDIANILEYPQEQVLFSGRIRTEFSYRFFVPNSLVFEYSYRIFLHIITYGYVIIGK